MPASFPFDPGSAPEEHAPGTALTIELQEDSDVLSMFQALNAGRIISKELLFKDVRREDRERDGDGKQWWIFYDSTKFSGKRLVVPPGGRAEVVERGVYTVLVWSGRGSFGGHDVHGGDPRLTSSWSRTTPRSNRSWWRTPAPMIWSSSRSSARGSIRTCRCGR